MENCTYKLHWYGYIYKSLQKRHEGWLLTSPNMTTYICATLLKSSAEYQNDRQR